MTWWRIWLIGILVLAGCGGGDDGGGSDTDPEVGGVEAVEDEVVQLIEENPSIEEGVLVTEVDCPDDVQLDDGEPFACEAQLESAVGEVSSADLELAVEDSGEIVLCSLTAEGFFITTMSDACGTDLVP